MRHRVVGRVLSRSPSHRLALFRNLTRALVEHGRITTTVAKAKELRRFVEPLITLGKDGSLHARRRALALLPDVVTVRKIFDELGPRYADRPGGYTRILKLSQRRLGDAGETAIIELLREGETKKAKAPQPLAPTVEN